MDTWTLRPWGLQGLLICHRTSHKHHTPQNVAKVLHPNSILCVFGESITCHTPRRGGRRHVLRGGRHAVCDDHQAGETTRGGQAGQGPLLWGGGADRGQAQVCMGGGFTFFTHPI